MKLNLRQCIGHYTAEEIQQTRAYYAKRKKTTQNRAQLDIATPDGLHRAREMSRNRVEMPTRKVEKQQVSWNNREIQIRIIWPQSHKPKGVHLDFPGGGFYLSMAARNDVSNEQLADALGIVVVCVDYRLAPEHPWPAAPDDCEAAALWLIEKGKDTFDTDNFTMGGFSAGSNLAMVVMLRLRERGILEAFKSTVLQFGAYDCSGQTPGGRPYADEYFIQAYVGHVPDTTHPDISPIFGELSNLLPTLIIVGTEDPVLEDSITLAARLIAAGCETDIRIYPESPHGFTLAKTPIAIAARADIAAWLAPSFDTQRGYSHYS